MKEKFERIIFVTLLIWTVAGVATVNAQSIDQNLPTPIRSNEISGSIAALDIGDPRLTRHFYAFDGRPGDLLITLDSRNLNGDIDIFTAITFRPLMKATMYANTLSSTVSKGIYLRQKQILILRVEARTPNDDAGTYHIRFGGSFEAFSGGIPVAENTEASADTSTPTSGGRRVSSVGATIPQPVTEKPAVAEAQPSPEASEKPAEETAKKTTTKPRGRTPAPRTPARTTTTRRGARPAPAKPVSAEPKKEEETAKKGTSSTGKPDTPSGGTVDTSKPKQEVAIPQPAARLIIEQKDGTRIERPMSLVRRVVVEGNTIVIVLKTGKIERVYLSSVSRMSIEPQ
jgi:hypothetical protein